MAIYTGNNGENKKKREVGSVIRDTAAQVVRDNPMAQKASEINQQTVQERQRKAAADAAAQRAKANQWKPAANTYTKPSAAGLNASQYTQQDYQNASDMLVNTLNNRPGQFQSRYDGTIQDTLNKILNGEKFSYDFNADPLYQQARDKYKAMGQSAMMDTMGQAAALTGGYGNSYAAAAGQQVYQQTAGQANDIIPQLQQAAYERYLNERADLKDQLGLLSGLEQNDYGRYRDNVGDWQNDRTYWTGLEGTKYDRVYRAGRDEIEDNRYVDETAYSRGRDAIADARYADETAYSRGRDAISDARYADETAYARGRDAIADARYKDETEYARSTVKSGGNSGSVPDYVLDGVERIAGDGGNYYEIRDYLGRLVKDGVISSSQMDAIAGGYEPRRGLQEEFEYLVGDVGKGGVGLSADEAYRYLIDNGYLTK